MPKVRISKDMQPADIDDAVADKINRSPDYYAGTVEALQSKVEQMTSIIALLAKVINEAGLMGTEDVGAIIGYDYSVEAD